MIKTLVTNEEAAMDFTIPEAYNINEMIENLKVKKEITDRHKTINKIISKNDMDK